MEEFTRLLIECIEKEFDKVSVMLEMFMQKFIGQEMNMKLFLNTRDGACNMGHVPRSEPEIFRTIRLTLPNTEKDVSMSHLIHQHYSVSPENIMMKCSECCQHHRICPQTGKCRLREAVEKRALLVSPKFLYIQLLRFSGHISKIQSKVIPENVLVLPNGDKYQLVSIGNHLGSQTTNGHYQALIKSGSTWVLANDDKNYKTSIQEHINGNNYIFLYTKFSTKNIFVPSENWEEVLEDQPIPRGLNVKLDLQTGKKFARYAEQKGTNNDNGNNAEELDMKMSDVTIDDDNLLRREKLNDLRTKVTTLTSIEKETKEKKSRKKKKS